MRSFGQNNRARVARPFWRLRADMYSAYWALFGVSAVACAFLNYHLVAAASAQNIQFLRDLPKVVVQPQPLKLELPGALPIDAIAEDYQAPSSLWVIVNKKMSVPIDYAPSDLVLAPVAARGDKSSDERSVRSELVAPLQAMFADAAAAGHNLMIGSAYRSPTLQQTYFNNYVASSGQAAAEKLSALPGHSEHQTGLAVDISTLDMRCYLDECFTNTADSAWLVANSYKYGFTLSYPQGKTHITGYNFEPWHYRFVGISLATALHQSGLIMDEAKPYLDTLREKVVKRLR